MGCCGKEEEKEPKPKGDKAICGTLCVCQVQINLVFLFLDVVPFLPMLVIICNSL